MDLEFEWDEDKNGANISKHGVDFNEAAQVFLDPRRIERLDDRDHGEDRWQVMGMVSFSVLFVVYTERGAGDVVRIISARRATRAEEKRYRSGRF